jgi:rRNA maturation RNase YbeY
MDINFNFPSKISLNKRTDLKKYISTIFKKEKKIASALSFIFCSDRYLLQINKDFLRHNYFTDIITFDLSEPGSGIISGEIYISTDTVRTNAGRFKTTISKELHRVMFHGVLHLCGYADKTKKEKAIMTQKEDHYLAGYFK